MPPYARLLGGLSGEEEAGVGDHACLDCRRESTERRPSPKEWSMVAESQKPCRHVGIADRKVFARLESFCAFLQNWPYIET